MDHYRFQRLLNCLCNSTFSPEIIPTCIGFALFLLATLQGSVLNSLYLLPVPVILNCVVAIICTYIGVRYTFETGGKLGTRSMEIKKLLWLNHCKDRSSSGRVHRKNEIRQILNSIIELRVCVLYNSVATTKKFAVFIDAALVQSINYLLALRV